MNELYNALLGDFVARAEQRSVSSKHKNSNSYKLKKTVPGYVHPNKKRLIGNQNKVLISQDLVIRVAERCECEHCSISAAWRAEGSLFSLMGVSQRVKKYRASLQPVTNV
jgi:hypothetical protein